MKLERGNGCDIQPTSRWMNIPTRTDSTSIRSWVAVVAALMGVRSGVGRAYRLIDLLAADLTPWVRAATSGAAGHPARAEEPASGALYGRR